MLKWPNAAILEKNRLASDAPFLTLVKMVYGSLDPIYIARNNEDVNWNGEVWTAYPLNVGNNTVDNKEEPSLSITVSNAGGLLQKYLQEYNGFGGAALTIYVVHAKYLDETTPLEEFDFMVANTSYDEQWVTFKLSASPEIHYQFPVSTYAAKYCPYKFKSVRCGYAGTASACNNTADTCRIPTRFGGEEGMNSV